MCEPQQTEQVHAVHQQVGDARKKEMRKEVFHVAWPALTELFLTTLASIVDLIMVGTLGPAAISAVGFCQQPRFLALAAFVALNTGATALIARFKGAGEHAAANRVMRQNLLLTIGVSVVVGVLGAAFAGPIMQVMGAIPGQASYAGAVDYFRIQMYGLLAMTLPLAVSAALRGVGNTKAAMRLNLIANLVNIVLNYLLIGGNLGFPRMEVAGASLATVLGNVVAAAGGLYVLMRGRHYVRLQKGDSFKPDFPLIGRIVRIGGPTMLEQVVLRVGLIIFLRAVAGLGEIAFATHQVTVNILSLSFMNGQAFGIAATTLVGQSLGRDRPDEARQYTSYCQQMGFLISTVLALLFFFFGRQFVWLFVFLSPDVAASADMMVMGAQVLQVIAVIQPIQASQLIYSGALYGAGDTKTTALIVFLGLIVVRPIFIYLCMNLLHWGLVGAWVACAVDQAVRALLITIRFRSGKWSAVRV
nr:MATE family efflux transporter [Maliibacterium massiliense]